VYAKLYFNFTADPTTFEPTIQKATHLLIGLSWQRQANIQLYRWLCK